MNARSINRFCKDFDIKRAHLYRLWNKGEGPERKFVGGKVLITDEAGRAWLDSLPSERVQ